MLQLYYNMTLLLVTSSKVSGTYIKIVDVLKIKAVSLFSKPLYVHLHLFKLKFTIKHFFISMAAIRDCFVLTAFHAYLRELLVIVYSSLCDY